MIKRKSNLTHAPQDFINNYLSITLSTQQFQQVPGLLCSRSSSSNFQDYPVHAAVPASSRTTQSKQQFQLVPLLPCPRSSSSKFQDYPVHAAVPASSRTTLSTQQFQQVPGLPCPSSSSSKFHDNPVHAAVPCTHHRRQQSWSRHYTAEGGQV